MSFTAIVMAAGKGTRMRSELPKVLHPVCGRPMVHWPVRAALEAGADDVVVVGGPDRALEGGLPEGVRLAVQPVADGTGGAVRDGLAEASAAERVVVLSGDVPLVTAAALRALVDAHEAAGSVATMLTTRLADPAGYGRVVRDAGGAVLDVVETKDGGDATPEQLAIDEVNAGIYCFAAAPLREALAALRPDNAQAELYLPQVLGLLRAQKHVVAAHVADDPAVVLGVNDRAQLAAVTRLAQERIVDAHLRAGVTFLAPATAAIDADVTIGADTAIEAGVVLKGRTAIGSGCVVGPQATLTDCRLGDRVRLLHAVGVEATCDDGASVGPFAYLRPGAHLRAGAKAGTYVEIKNSDIGEGAKVPHLSYVGDADVGPRTNLGAGTITANYDGTSKHRTTIGADVRSSVHVSFVAPVAVGDRAWTAAGSVITKDVPAEALGVARPRQTNIEGYARRKG